MRNNRMNYKTKKEPLVRAKGCLKCDRRDCMANQPITLKNNNQGGSLQPCNTRKNVEVKEGERILFYVGYQGKSFLKDY